MIDRLVIGLVGFLIALLAGRMFAPLMGLFNELWGWETTPTENWTMGTILAALMIVPIVAAAGRPASVPSFRRQREIRTEHRRVQERVLPVGMRTTPQTADGDPRFIARCNTCLMELPVADVDLNKPECPFCREGYMQITPRA